ncbi:MAG: hypothetical protein ACEQSB_00370 [Undibacterium sp.]
MEAVKNWKSVLRYAWSVRLIVISGLLSGVEAILPYISGSPESSSSWVTVLTFVVTVSALIARFVAQPEVKDSV